MDCLSVKDKLRRGRTRLKHGFSRDGSSKRSSTAGSADSSARGSDDDERPNRLSPSRSRTRTPSRLSNAPATSKPHSSAQTTVTTSSASIAPASSVVHRVPQVLVSSPSNALESSASDSIQTVPYSTLSQTKEDAGPDYGISARPASPEKPQPSAESSRLWQDAYKRLRNDQKDLILNYELILKDAANIDHDTDLRDEVARVVSFQKERMENAQWTFQWNDKPQKVRDTLHKILKITEKAASLISMGMEYAPPYVSIPWAALGAILPFMLSGFADEEDGIAGLEKVAQIISSYRIVEDAFLCNPQTTKLYAEAVIPLYVKVLEYQALAAQHFGLSTLKRFGLGAVGSTDWNGALSEICDLDNRSRGSILHLGIQVQEAGFEKMQGNFNSLIGMFKNHDEVMRNYLKEYLVQKGEVDQLKADLSTIPYIQDHREVRNRLRSKYYGSGQWFLTNETLSNWRDWRPGFGVLWLEGGVGTGKSSLVSMLLEDLARTPSGDLAFFYCSKKASTMDLQLTARDIVENVLRTLIIQLSLAADGTSISEEVRDYHARSKQGIRGGGMDLEDCKMLLEGIISKENRPRITIVIDALDECINFRELLNALQLLFAAQDGVRIFLSSRFDVDVKSHFKEAQKIVIERQNASDILHYFDTEIADRRVDSGITESQINELKEIIMRRHEGMFLWVVLVIDNVLDENAEDRPKLEEDVQIRISALKDSTTDAEKSEKLSSAYDTVYMKAIGKGKQPTRRHIVDLALKWALSSFRPLTLKELTIAISVPIDGKSVGKIQPGLIFSFCSNLLIEGSGGTIRFAHLSVRHYLERKVPPDYSPIEAQILAATTDLLFLTSPASHEITSTTLEISFNANTSLAKDFSSYANAYWSRHCREARKNILAYGRENADWQGSSNSDDHESRLLSAKYQAAFDTLEKLINQLRPSSYERCRGKDDFAKVDLLREAVQHGDEPMVEVLLATNTELDMPDEFGNTALHEAVRWNQLNILERLLDVGATLNASNLNGDSPLHFAAFWGFEDILQALISAGAKRNAQNHRGETALHVAVVQGHREIVRILLAAGSNKTLEDKWSKVPLHYTKSAKDLLRDNSISNLLDPPKAPDKIYRSPLVKFAGLCDYCDLMRWISTYPKTTSHRHLQSYGDLKSSAKGGCSLCGLLLQEFEKMNCQALFDEGYSSEISISLLLVSRQKSPDSDNDILKATMGGAFTVEFELCLDSKSDIGPLKDDISGRLIAQTPYDQTCFDLIQSWRMDCSKNHPQCLKVPSPLPLRVIDVGPSDGSHEPLLYVSKSGEFGDYIYLSAKRSGHLNGHMLLASNLDDYQQSLPLSLLPKTYEDAVQITRRLGVRYLWIDAYCILQDHVEDWVSEATKMGDYLTNSTCTLIAASATGSDHGIYTKRESSEPLIRLPCDEVLGSSTSAQPWSGFLYLRRPTKSALEAMSDSVLQRGWMVQELVLPERNVIFGNEQIYWNCQKLSRSEDTTYYQNPLLRLNGTRTTSGDSSEELLERWYHLVEIYSGTLHTKPTDRLPGLSHMVQHMVQQVQSRYIAGLWQSSFIRGLLWRAKVMSRADRFQVYIAPSWSWASFNGRVSYNLGLVEKVESPHNAEILDVQIVPGAKSETNGILKSGFLKLRASSQKISRSSIPKECNFYFDDAGYEAEWRTGREFFHVVVHVWPAAGNAAGSKSAGLILRRVDGKAEEFQRVGLVTGPDDFGNILKIEERAWEKMEFTII